MEILIESDLKNSEVGEKIQTLCETLGAQIDNCTGVQAFYSPGKCGERGISIAVLFMRGAIKYKKSTCQSRIWLVGAEDEVIQSWITHFANKVNLSQLPTSPVVPPPPP